MSVLRNNTVLKTGGSFMAAPGAEMNGERLPFVPGKVFRLKHGMLEVL